MTLLHVLRAEILKLKRTVALGMVVIAPFIVVLMVFYFDLYGSPTRQDAWVVLARQIMTPWVYLVLPMFITLETALTAGLDHTDNQWKSLLCRPAPRWTFYVAKLLVVAALVAGSTLIVVLGTFADGMALQWLQSAMTFGSEVPWPAIAGNGIRVVLLAALELTIQHWVSLRWKSFAVAVGAGIMTMMVGLYASTEAVRDMGGPTQYVPWALPAMIFYKKFSETVPVMIFGFAAAVIVAAAGCLEFSRREVQ